MSSWVVLLLGSEPVKGKNCLGSGDSAELGDHLTEPKRTESQKQKNATDRSEPFSDSGTVPDQNQGPVWGVSSRVDVEPSRRSRCLTWTKVVFPEPAMPSTIRHTGEFGTEAEPPSAPDTELSRLSGESVGAAAAAMLLGAIVKEQAVA